MFAAARNDASFVVEQHERVQSCSIFTGPHGQDQLAVSLSEPELDLFAHEAADENPSAARQAARAPESLLRARRREPARTTVISTRAFDEHTL